MAAEFCETTSYDGQYRDETPTMILTLGKDPVYVIQREGATRDWLMSRAAGVALTQTDYCFKRVPDNLLQSPRGRF